MTQLTNKYFILFLFCLSFFNVDAQVNLFDHDNSLKFARYLKITNQLTFATEEYEKLHFLWPNDSTIKIELLQTYRLNGQCDKLSTIYSTFLYDPGFLKNNTFKEEYLRYILTCRVKLSTFDELTSTFAPSRKSFYQLSYRWVNHDYKSAIGYCKTNQENNENLFKLTMALDNEKQKSGALAGILSAIVPGSGKAYSKRWGDALISFLFVGANSYSSYVSFKKKGISSTNGWIFGGMAFSFYSANIWGSVKAAKKYNLAVKEKYQKNAENIIYSNF